MELNRIYPENCLETLERIPPGSLDMTLTSPPYDDARTYGGFDVWRDAQDLVRGLYFATAPGGVVIWVTADKTVDGSETGTSLRSALDFMAAGFKLWDTMIFGKNNPMPGDTGKRYRQAFEYMFCFSKGSPKTFNPLTVPVADKSETFKSFRVTKEGRGDLAEDRVAPSVRKASNIFMYNVGSASSKDRVAFRHPAIFPEKLAEDMVKTWSNPGDLVYDPFTGSGTTLKLAKILRRNFIGSEINPDYCKIAEARLAQYTVTAPPPR